MRAQCGKPLFDACLGLCGTFVLTLAPYVAMARSVVQGHLTSHGETVNQADDYSYLRASVGRQARISASKHDKDGQPAHLIQQLFVVSSAGCLSRLNADIQMQENEAAFRCRFIRGRPNLSLSYL